jgi:ubiquinone/menaquinone biosynthesis C-methylase UbiE
MQSEAEDIRRKILNHYYANIYKKYLFDSKRQSRGIEYFERFLETFWRSDLQQIEKVLEIGGGQGEHLKFLTYVPTSEYVSLDLRTLTDTSHLATLESDLKSKINFVTGDAENIPYQENYFDRTFSTCLLHHVDDPLQVLLEARRVTKIGGEIVFAMPTDPGLLNQTIKKIISYRVLKKFTDFEPALFYALEHKNHVGGLLTLIKFVYQADKIKIKYGPFPIKSWNLNLVVGVHITKSENRPDLLLPEVFNS